MAEYRWTGSHAYRDHANDQTIEPGEELPAEIADRVAGAHPTDVEGIEDDGDGDGDDTAAESDDIEWSEEAWLEGDYSERADAVADGRVDDHLDDIEDCETSDNVIEAIEERRDELAE
jgi:hypothetical protein